MAFLVDPDLIEEQRVVRADRHRQQQADEVQHAERCATGRQHGQHDQHRRDDGLGNAQQSAPRPQVRQQQHAHRERAQQGLQEGLVQVARVQRAEFGANVDDLRAGQAGQRGAQLRHVGAHRSRRAGLQAEQRAPGPAFDTGHEQGIQRSREWRALQRGAGQQSLPARNLHVFDEATEAARRQGAIGGGLFEPRRQRRGVRQRRAPRGLRGRAGQQARGRVVALQRAAVDELVEPRAGGLGKCQRPGFVGRRERDQRAGVRGPEVGPQVFIDLHLLCAHRAQRTQVAAPG